MFVTVTRLNGPDPVTGILSVQGPLQESLRSSLRGEWEETPFRGAVMPHVGFSHNAAQTQSFQFVITASVEEGDDRDLSDVQADKGFLDALVYSEVDDQASFLRPPPWVIITMQGGGLVDGKPTTLRRWIGAVRGLDAVEKLPMDPNTGLPYGYDVTLDLLVTEPRLAADRLIPSWPNIGDFLGAGLQ